MEAMQDVLTTGPQIACVLTSVAIFALVISLSAGSSEKRARFLGGDGEFHFEELLAEHMSMDCRGLGLRRFGFLRLAFGCFCLGTTAIRIWGMDHPWVMATFTFWSWSLMGLYFITVGIFSLFKACMGGDATYRDNRGNAILYVLWVVCQIVAVCAVFIFLIVWAVLIPLEMSINGWEGKDGELATREKFFNWISFSAHNVNVLFMIVELYYNRMTVLRSHAPFIVIYANCYIVFSWFYYWFGGGHFWYAFLDWNLLGYFTPVCYIGLASVLYATFLMVARFSVRLKKGASPRLFHTQEGTPADMRGTETIQLRSATPTAEATLS